MNDFLEKCAKMCQNGDYNKADKRFVQHLISFDIWGSELFLIQNCYLGYLFNDSLQYQTDYESAIRQIRYGGSSKVGQHNLFYLISLKVGTNVTYEVTNFDKI